MLSVSYRLSVIGILRRNEAMFWCCAGLQGSASGNDKACSGKFRKLQYSKDAT